MINQYTLCVSIKSYRVCFNKSLFSVYFYYQNYFGLKKVGVNLFYTYFTVHKVSVNYRNIITMKYKKAIDASVKIGPMDYLIRRLMLIFLFIGINEHKLCKFGVQLLRE